MDFHFSVDPRAVCREGCCCCVLCICEIIGFSNTIFTTKWTRDNDDTAKRAMAPKRFKQPRRTSRDRLCRHVYAVSRIQLYTIVCAHITRVQPWRWRDATFTQCSTTSCYYRATTCIIRAVLVFWIRTYTYRARNSGARVHNTTFERVLT